MAMGKIWRDRGSGRISTVSPMSCNGRTRLMGGEDAGSGCSRQNDAGVENAASKGSRRFFER